MSEIFRRVEKKYIITKNQYLMIKQIINQYMKEDEYGQSRICNIYFDSPNYDLIRNSIEKPAYKDKVRVRSYNTPKLDSKVYLEIKRKYDGVVGKRRIEIQLKDFYKYMNKEKINVGNSQIFAELDYYFKFYNLESKMYISYLRSAFYGKDDKDFRITFDSDILARDTYLNLESGNYRK